MEPLAGPLVLLELPAALVELVAVSQAGQGTSGPLGPAEVPSPLWPSLALLSEPAIDVVTSVPLSVPVPP